MLRLLLDFDGIIDNGEKEMENEVFLKYVILFFFLIILSFEEVIELLFLVFLFIVWGERLLCLYILLCLGDFFILF